MRKLTIAFAAAGAALFLAGQNPAQAQSVSPQQIQAQIANGQAQTALSELQPVLQAHPDSAVAWYLSAEAQDAAGNEAAARSALGKAEHYAPGLPFANPSDVTALKSHLANSGEGVAPARAHAGPGPALFVIIGLVVLFLVLRLFRRRRYVMPNGFQQGYGPQGPYQQPYGPGPAPGGGFGSGLGGSLLGGLAAGAGFAAGERVIDDMFNRGNADAATPLQDPNFGAPGRDDGLLGNPGWDSGSSDDDNFDPGNSW